MEFPIVTYAAIVKDTNIRFDSSSGGVFSALSKRILDRGGIVYGVGFNENCTCLRYYRIVSEDDLKLIRGSKYIQVNVGNSFKDVKHDLDAGNTVLFSGTACLINGLKLFLGKDYPLLLCVDVICHGVPSQRLWEKYTSSFCLKNGIKLINVNFRCKREGWLHYGVEYQGKDMSKFIPRGKDSYMQFFLNDYCLRPSCYKCVAKKNKLSDVTLGDFWGVQKAIPIIDDDKGISLVIIRTDKGKTFFQSASDELYFIQVDYAEVIKNNPYEYQSCVRPKQRNTFFLDCDRMDLDSLHRKYLSPSLFERLKQCMKKMLK